MQHLNWVQQNEDYATKYYILQWKTSHFHEPASRHVSGGARLGQRAGAVSQAGGIQQEPELSLTLLPAVGSLSPNWAALSSLNRRCI